MLLDDVSSIVTSSEYRHADQSRVHLAEIVVEKPHHPVAEAWVRADLTRQADSGFTRTVDQQPLRVIGDGKLRSKLFLQTQCRANTRRHEEGDQEVQTINGARESRTHHRVADKSEGQRSQGVGLDEANQVGQSQILPPLLPVHPQQVKHSSFYQHRDHQATVEQPEFDARNYEVESQEVCDPQGEREHAEMKQSGKRAPTQPQNYCHGQSPTDRKADLVLPVDRTTSFTADATYSTFSVV